MIDKEELRKGFADNSEIIKLNKEIKELNENYLEILTVMQPFADAYNANKRIVEEKHLAQYFESSAEVVGIAMNAVMNRLNFNNFKEFDKVYQKIRTNELVEMGKRAAVSSGVSIIQSTDLPSLTLPAAMSGGHGYIISDKVGNTIPIALQEIVKNVVEECMKTSCNSTTLKENIIKALKDKLL